MFCHSPYLSLLPASHVLPPTRTTVAFAVGTPGLDMRRGCKVKSKGWFFARRRKEVLKEALHSIWEEDPDFAEQIIE